jgi:hypothetical protein
MPQTIDLINFPCGDDVAQWPKLSCTQPGQLNLEDADLRLPPNRALRFQDNGEIRSFDANHRLVFNRTGGLLELHETGDIRFLTGGPTPSEKVRIGADGRVGIGTSAPTQELEVVGMVKATAFQGNGAALSGVSGTDTTKVAKDGDMMTGALSITAAGTGLHITNNASVGNTLTVGSNVGIGTTNPSRWPLTIRASGISEELISFQDPSGQTRWHINQNLGGSSPGLNFVETGVADGRLFHQAGGNVGIGIINPQHPVHMRGGAFCEGGRIWRNASSIAYKTDIAPLELTTAFETLAGLTPITFRYKEEEENAVHVGFIAEDVPALVASQDRKGISALEIVGILTLIVQHQQQEITSLRRYHAKV